MATLHYRARQTRPSIRSATIDRSAIATHDEQRQRNVCIHKERLVYRRHDHDRERRHRVTRRPRRLDLSRGIHLRLLVVDPLAIQTQLRELDLLGKLLL